MRRMTLPVLVFGTSSTNLTARRIPDSSEMLFTTAPTLRGLTVDMVARIRLDGEVLEGEVAPINKGVIDMHTAIYADHPACAWFWR
jgi:ribulose-5-phosphate 4-epimerase/fuculose-1-phosphate aldolase